MSAATHPVRVMIVEDSLVVRQLLTHIVGRDPRFLIVAAVASAEEALDAIPKVRPDVISMDIRLPGMDGLEATARIMADYPTPIVVIADAVEDAALRISMNALRAGALTVVEKPAGPANASYERLADTICTQLFIMSSVPVIRRRSIGGATTPLSRPPPGGAGAFKRLDFLALAASTGGPPALAKVIGALPADFPAPVFIVQHMGAAFMEGFAKWLGGLSAMPVVLAMDGARAKESHIYVAPGDSHLSVRGDGIIHISRDPPAGGQRPSANVLFGSLAEIAPTRTVAALLTGMGEDGAQGLSRLAQGGGHTIAEHASTAVVNGMPAAAVRLKAARDILPLDLIGPRIVQLAARGRT
ncbi:MAG: chemotaxis-specific protein-glutamate methyltransferase CheB [Phenylobacterium sp.]|uniref:chemotaxis-specific protein-glutamate methyltransferase CheB n=1 Tax=Phenylobacterium sp. TaxID=1871053 RepID=UPI00271C0DAD|nr:chemotaxis-specific protein-glutamate methyltransferase CheB [Phenylobacterium sp.]MDO8901887.1 chemotaxis-specific protein-glutamate methyltransferase CheB [Phenylobacterium sp.]